MARRSLFGVDRYARMVGPTAPELGLCEAARVGNGRRSSIAAVGEAKESDPSADPASSSYSLYRGAIHSGRKRKLKNGATHTPP